MVPWTGAASNLFPLQSCAALEGFGEIVGDNSLGPREQPRNTEVEATRHKGQGIFRRSISEEHLEQKM